MSTYTDASLIMFPSGYKEDKIYSLKPTDGSGDLTFTRASTATRVNSEGLIETSPVNLVQYSEDFTNAAWAKSASGGGTNPVVTANDATAPNGTLTADKIVFTSPVGEISELSQTIAKSGTNNGNFYIKAATSGDVGKIIGYRFGTGTYILVTLTADWVRVENAQTGTYGQFDFVLRSAVGTSSGTVSVHLWGAQLNIGATAKPYFPTTDRLNVPRLTYQNGGGGCPSLLLEKQSTNLITYSEQFDNAAWSKSRSTVTANATTSPSGVMDADTLTADGSLGLHQVAQTISVTNGAIYSISLYAKKGTNNFIQLAASSGLFGINFYANFNLDSGSVGSVGTSSTASILDMSNGWYRCTITGTAIATTSGNIAIVLISASTSVRLESNSLSTSVYIWGFQCEQGAYPTSYIPTTSSSATRVADACFKTGISSLIGQTEGVVFIDFEIQTTNQDMVVMNIYNQSAPINGIYFYVTGSNILQAFVDNSGTQATISSGVLAQGRYKAALVYKANDFAFYVNGSLIGVDTSGTVPTCNALRLENYASVPTYQEKMAVNQAILFPTRLTNTQLAQLTTL